MSALCATITTQIGATCAVRVAPTGDALVFAGSHRCGALAALAVAVALGGCGNLNFDTASTWFSKPVDLFGKRGGYTYSNLDDVRRDRPVTANDLVDASGVCPAPPADASALLGGGVAIGMSECEVVARLGPPTAANLGRNPNGDRSAMLTFNAGPRPGIYRFAGGRLTEMDRVELPPPPPSEPAKKKIVKKKPDKTKEPPATDSKT
jgi:hypothetical protein